jgi:hypothetical protein
MKTFFNRMIGAACLDSGTYEQVEADPASSAPAVLVVMSASVAAGLGSGISDPRGLIGITLVALVTWLVWVGLTYIIGTRLFPGPDTDATLGQVLRTTGFSATPGILRILGILPAIGWPIFIGITFWMLLTFVVAIRQALDYAGTGRALAVCFLGWLIQGLVFFAFVLTAI